MSSRFNYGTSQYDGVYEQRHRLLYDFQPQDQSPRSSFFDPTVVNTNLGNPLPSANPNTFLQQNAYTMASTPLYKSSTTIPDLGTRSNPISLESEHYEYLEVTPSVTSTNYIWPSNTIDLTNESNRYSRKRKSEYMEDGNPGYLPRIQTNPTTLANSISNGQWAGFYGSLGPGSSTMMPSFNNGSSGYDIAASYKTPTPFPNNIWNTQLLPSFNSSSPVVLLDEPEVPLSGNIIDLEQISPVTPFTFESESAEAMTDLAYKQTRHHTAPSRSGNISLLGPISACIDVSFSTNIDCGEVVAQERRAASQPFPSTIPKDLESVQEYFHSFLDNQRTTSLPCPHLSSAFAGIITAVKAETRTKVSNVPYCQDGKICSFKCAECKMTVCLGCATKLGNAKMAPNTQFHNCVDSHLLSIILTLARADARWLLRESSHPTTATQRKVSAPASSVAALPSGSVTVQSPNTFNNIPVFSSHQKSGVGYGSGYGGGVPGRRGGGGANNRRISKTPAKLRQESDDNKFLANLLTALASLLQDEENEYTVVSLLAEKGSLLISVMKISFLPELLQSLVRNDSIMDIDAGDTWDLYSACLELIRTLADHEPLLNLLVGALQEKKSSPGIANLIKLPTVPTLKGFAPSKKRVRTQSSPEPIDFVLHCGLEGVAQPIIQSFEKLVKQCQAFMSNASRVVTNEQDEETERLLAFCIDVDSTAIKLKRQAGFLQKKKDQSRPVSASKNSHLASLSQDMLSHPLFSMMSVRRLTGSLDPLDIPLGTKQECKEALTSHLQFKFSTSVATTHCGANPGMNFGSTAHAAGSAPNPGRMKRLIKELTVLSTTLPPGIFVRVQEDRPDLFKAMIVGPDSSPYHLGLYEFDFTIPNNYPNSPPTVTFRTTGGGRIRFNPNLYECGKVCLSILGTWSGSASEQWQPATSTLLQVLVSIQGMILCAEPYYNEPGHESNPSPPASKMYNENVQLNNMKVALNDWLSYTGLWNDVIQAHFLANTAEILATTLNFVNSGTDNNSVSTYANGNIEGFDDFDMDFSPFIGSAPNATMKRAMQKARDGLEKSMKNKLQGFLKAELWKERTEG
ncbi:hypothetical protein ABW20_dc0108015 [Dactylellina cionopaga]|nr:hypothetical protein ABW20_dc0108015 [Dactylellina cionopaga]